MDQGRGSRQPGEVRSAEDVGSSSEVSLSTASNKTLKSGPEGKTTDAERKKARRERRDARTKRKQEEEEEKKLQEKMSRKEVRRITREERTKSRDGNLTRGPETRRVPDPMGVGLGCVFDPWVRPEPDPNFNGCGCGF
jgi:hypothetical protein